MSKLLTNTIDLQDVLERLQNKASGGEQITPEISVSSNGLITATAGNKSSTYILTVKPAKTIIPTSKDQIAISSGYYTIGNIIVKGDSNLIASNIRNGVTIFGITGTFTGEDTTTPTIIIDGIEYQAEEGMTWEEWIASDYNINNFVIDNNNRCIYRSEEERQDIEDIRLWSLLANEPISREDMINLEDTYYFQGRT